MLILAILVILAGWGLAGVGGYAVGKGFYPGAIAILLGIVIAYYDHTRYDHAQRLEEFRRA